MVSRFTFLASPLLLIAGSVAAQDYPTKQISLVIPFAAGGPTDTLGRNLAVVMTQQLKQQVVVENVAGAGGTIASNRVAKAKPDGYSVLLHHIGMSTAPASTRTAAARRGASRRRCRLMSTGRTWALACWRG